MAGSSLRRIAPDCAPDHEILAPMRQEMDLLDRSAVRDYLAQHRPDLIIHAAAKVGGILSNMDNPASFLSDNILINTHLIREAFAAGVRKLIYFGSSCMYPRDFGRPLTEDDILAAPLEPTNEGYAIAKIAGARLCCYLSQQYGVAYRTLIPCNLYGPNDRYDPQHSHLMAAIIRKTHEAVMDGRPTIEIWGHGEVRREFVYVDDLARFVFSILERLNDLPDTLNIGMGRDYTVNEYYHFAAKAIGFRGDFTHNLAAPVGMAQKLMDCTRAMALGWSPATPLLDGICRAYQDFSGA